MLPEFGTHRLVYKTNYYGILVITRLFTNYCCYESNLHKNSIPDVEENCLNCIN